VFGRAVANRTAQILKPGTPLPVIPASVGEESIANIDRVLHANGSLKTAEIRLNMQKTMQQYAAVFRTKDTLEIGAKKIEEVATQMKDMQVSDRSLVWNTDLIESLELQNLMTQVCTRHALCWQQRRDLGHPAVRSIRARERSECSSISHRASCRSIMP